MALADLCVAELYRYFGLPAPAAADSSHDGPEFRASVARYRRFRTQAGRRLRSLGEAAGVDFFYVTLPALLEAALAVDGPAAASDDGGQTARLVDEFLAGYRQGYQPFSLHDVAFKTLEKRLFNRVGPAAPSLELGVGNGFTSDFIFRGHQLTVGSDPFFSELWAARHYGRHQQLVAIDGAAIPYPDSSFATAYMVHAIDHVPERLDILREFARVLAPGGTLALTDFSEQAPGLMPLGEIHRLLGFPGLASSARDYFMDYAGDNRCFYSPDDYRRALAGLGLEDVQISYFVSPPLARVCWLWFELQLAAGGFSDALALLRSRAGRRARESYFAFIRRAIVPLLAADEGLCAGGQGMNLFVTARKPGPAVPPPQPPLVCPACRQPVAAAGSEFGCPGCGARYPVLRDVPLMTAYYAQGYAALAPRLGPARRQLAAVRSRLGAALRRYPLLVRAARGLSRRLRQGRPGTESC